jgi:hypothetical protein
VSKLTSNVLTLVDIPGLFTYDKAEVMGSMTSPSGGLMLLTRNDTFAMVQLYDRLLNPLEIARLVKPVTITFKMPPDARVRYLNNFIQLQCASRDGFMSQWNTTRITLASINNATGEVSCLATHFT